MKERKEVPDKYVINGFKTFSVLATEYFPDATIDSARRQMRDRIDSDLSASIALREADYNSHTKQLSPKMQEILIRNWGPPCIVLSASDVKATESNQPKNL
ncbi:DUF4248 domain-containing protein [uncultured Bacteroides sp.]|uniref:DUF4248 domain-containing protein n=1 Tax=uncultured Bacteroides sp. TaxID=162156 RepID=UPI0025D0A12B|nr:DUF4248 domain-containing protein [uncultured Bacteroides sp.]